MIPEFSPWLPGTYGMQRPAVLVTADALIYRIKEGGVIEILTGKRALFQKDGVTPTRWEGGLPMLTFGGFVDPLKDASIYDTVKREVTREELKGIKLVTDFGHPFHTGPVKIRHQWHRQTQRAISTGNQVQDVPIITANFLARYVSGELKDSEEVTAPRWALLEDLNGDFAFDHALVLQHFLPQIVFQV